MTDTYNGATVKPCVATKELIVGNYVAGAKAASTGYILVKTSDGVARKVMVQAA